MSIGAMTLQVVDSSGNVLFTTDNPAQFNYLINNPMTGHPETLYGRGNASAVVRGTFYQVGDGATKTSIPLLSSSGLAMVLSDQAQSRLIGSTLEIVIDNNLEEAVVTDITSTGTLTLDGPLSATPALATPCFVIPLETTSHVGSGEIFNGTYTVTGTGDPIFSSQVCSSVLVQNDPSSNGPVYVGGAGAQTISLAPGAAKEYQVSNVNLIYAKFGTRTTSATLNWEARS